ncbi:hypothetical protein BGW37DRAFT_496684 [Umbelopsis sp. PMI_123]|nr:hypothetical protein BGW37DRAFT_496684 [Umbelopsis sp. PMI_123]
MDYSKFRFPYPQYTTLNSILSAAVDKHSLSTYIQYWRDPSDDHPCSLTYREVDNITNNLAHRLQNEQNIQGKAVALLADHSIHYGFYMMALLKLECRVMLLSTRNSEAALVELMKKTDTKLLIYTKRFANISSQVIDQITGGASYLATDVDIDQLKEKSFPKPLVATDDNEEDKTEKIPLIIHSSGTTGFPHPIYLSNRYLVHLVNQFAMTFDTIQSPKFLSLSPLFHIMGIGIFAVAIVGGTFIFPTNFPPLADTFIDSIRKSQANCVIAPPFLLEQLAEQIKVDSKAGDVLRSVKLVLFGGAALHPQSGNILIEHGLNIKSAYGTTEIGVAAFADEDPTCKEFTPMRFLVPQEFYIMEDTELDSETKHLVIKPNSPFLASNVGNRPDGSYATKDLWRPHPSKPGYWIICGRADDTLIMSNGEKTNPLPMEAAIRNFHHLIEQCVVIGHGRAATCLLVQLDANEAMRRDIYDILNIVETAVDIANRDAPSHSKIVFPDMVKVLPLIEKLPMTDKGTISRKKSEKIYEKYVEQMYSKFFDKSSDLQQDTSDENKLPLEPTLISDFLKSTIASLIKIKPTEVKTTVNIFEQGLDSLLAVQLRNSIVKNIKNVATNFVFQNSTIESMTDAICGDSEDDVVEKSYKQTRSLLKKYIKLIDEKMPKATASYQKRHQDSEVVVLTGATGSLGALILRDLLQNNSVRKVYALVRGTNGLKRLIKSFSERSLDTNLLHSGKLEVYPLDQAQQNLGLNPDQYKTLQSEATVICHCAWMLDFLQPVTYYEKECINGLFNLLQLAYNNGENAMRFYFMSSVSASMAMKGEVLERPLPDDPSCAAPMGYAQSKFIAEHLMGYVTQTKNIQGYVVRIGQMSGDTERGYWNPQEQYPLMIAGGAVHMQKMPTMKAEIDWIPLDYSAASIVEIIINTANDAPSLSESIFHIVSPNRITWMDFLEALHANGLNFSEVAPEEWIKELSEDDSNPAIKLISFYQDIFGETQMPIWVTKKTESVSPKLQKTPKIDSTLVGKYLQNWKRMGFIN